MKYLHRIANQAFIKSGSGGPPPCFPASCPDDSPFNRPYRAHPGLKNVSTLAAAEMAQKYDALFESKWLYC